MVWPIRLVDARMQQEPTAANLQEKKQSKRPPAYAPASSRHPPRTLVHAESVFLEVSWSAPASTEQPSEWSQEKLKLADDFAASVRSDAYLVVHHGTLLHAYGDISKTRKQLSSQYAQ
ncbi:hypothetical protein ASE52_19010 [Acidovorax sp. Root275]|nr:hypothetical protein ASE52_19010 [Acidovorax sp. Root275]